MKKRILFQGDSITDAGRSRENDNFTGSGYATLIASELGYNRPNEFEFLNRGIGGNRSIDVLARVKCDIINLKPDYISVLMGINDVLHEIELENGIDAEKFELYYNMLINQIRDALPDVKIMILEPFLLRGELSEIDWEQFRRGAEERADISKRVAETNGLIFVPLMKKFDEATKIAPSSYWTCDGVHPTAMGHEIIKNEWLKGFEILERK